MKQLYLCFINLSVKRKTFDKEWYSKRCLRWVMQGHKCTLAIPTNLYALVFYTGHTCHGRSCRIVSCIGIHLSPVCTQRKDNCVYTTIGKTLMSGFFATFHWVPSCTRTGKHGMYQADDITPNLCIWRVTQRSSPNTSDPCSTQSKKYLTRRH